MTREAVAALDRDDPLARYRDLFHLPAGLIYFDGNSLGPLVKSSRRRLYDVMERQWGDDLIRSWEHHGWIDLPREVGSKTARLIGADDDEVVVTDSTSVNLFKLLAVALQLRPGRRVILSETSQFPTDLYMARGVAELFGKQYQVQLVDSEDPELDWGHEVPDHEVAVVCLSHVGFKTGALLDMAAITRAAHDGGALVLWDLSHSAGALEIDLGACGVDLAVGCGYKFLNGGPGAPAFLYVARRLQDDARSPLPGWLGHEQPFAFDLEYRPAPGIGRFLCGTPPILSLAALDAAMDLYADVDLGEVRRKSMALGDLFLDLVRRECADSGLAIACPLDAKRRGSQVSLRHEEGYAVVQALIARGVVADFRTPDVLRFGLAPLYLRYTDIWDAVEILREVLETRAWDEPRYRQRGC
ncbi:MAG: kynureninase [bacterium]|nr:kynureninase [bacterium]